MSKFRILALEKETMVEFMFPIDDTKPKHTNLQAMYEHGDISMEEVKNVLAGMLIV